MQDLPEKSQLLDALAKFIDTDLRPAIQDPALVFRARIAAHLAGVVAREIRAEDEHDAAELSRLAALLGRAPVSLPASHAERKRVMSELNRALAKALREGTLDREARAAAHRHLKA